MLNLARVSKLMCGLLTVFVDVLTLFRLAMRSSSALAAENLFLRKQLSLYVERKEKPRHAANRIRFTLVQPSRCFEWRDALTIVKPDTLIRWHRKGFRLFWKWKSRSSGRPRVPADLRKLIMEMATNNPTWEQKRIANELLLKIGIQISPRTVCRYMPTDPKRQPARTSQRWITFVRNHAKAIIAADFFVVVTATFRLVYVLVIMEIGTRRILHFNVTQHPTAEWTLQQFRECVAGDEGYKFIIHDRDSIYSRELDSSLRTFSLSVLRTPYRSPQANAFCERLIGSARRECLDFMIPLNESHIGQMLKSWTGRYNRSRPHSSLGLGIPSVKSPESRTSKSNAIVFQKIIASS
ncbi:MAG TPA: integrase core domain-containing protein [Terriglobia bacterium]|nr:integrase core domain-containing protein [Terriglobia bacterium]